MAARPTTLLLILDGWGANADEHGNAIALTPTPNWDRLLREHPHRQLLTHGEDCGLPAGQMGNSEVGHINIGAGRVVYQSLSRIDRALASGELARIPVWVACLQELRARGGRLHVLGLLSDGGVHSHQNHIEAICRLAAEAGVAPVLHLLLDGRDTEPRSAVRYLSQLQSWRQAMPKLSVASISGRYYAMDRDNRWQRTEKAYRAIVEASAAFSYRDAEQALAAAYERGESDEFVQPSVIAAGVPIDANDSVISCNFRADRMRQLCAALTNENVQFVRRQLLPGSQLFTMTDYGADCPARALFPQQQLVNDLGQWLSLQGCSQLRLAETEKFPHVSYFFSGGKEQAYAGERRLLVPSPKVATYDLQPEMSAPEVTAKLCAAIGGGEFDFILCNIANGDMVGHSGSLPAACQAVACVDACLGKILAALEQSGSQALITADHGNCEQMYVGASEQPHTAHTTNPVEIIYYGPGDVQLRPGSARLADIAPSVLRLMQLPIPEQMTGSPLC